MLTSMKRLLILIIVAFGILYFLKPNMVKDGIKSGGMVLSETIQKQKGNGKKVVEQETDRIVKNSTNSINSQVKNTVDTVATYIKEKSETVLGAMTETGTNVAMEQVENLPSDQKNKVINIDFHNPKKEKYTFLANQTYYLKISNLPINQCLFVNQNKYTVDENKFIKLEFSKKGNHSLLFDYCNSEDKVWGEIVVE
jgi:tRNA-binding EMAP/Myf-like protein